MDSWGCKRVLLKKMWVQLHPLYLQLRNPCFCLGCSCSELSTKKQPPWTRKPCDSEECCLFALIPHIVLWYDTLPTHPSQPLQINEVINSKDTMSSSTRGWVTVNVFWLIQKGLEEVRLVPPDTKQTIELCPTASSLHKKLQTDKVPPPVHVSPLYETFLYYIGVNISLKIQNCYAWCKTLPQSK